MSSVAVARFLRFRPRPPRRPRRLLRRGVSALSSSSLPAVASPASMGRFSSGSARSADSAAAVNPAGAFPVREFFWGALAAGASVVDAGNASSAVKAGATSVCVALSAGAAVFFARGPRVVLRARPGAAAALDGAASASSGPDTAGAAAFVPDLAVAVRLLPVLRLGARWALAGLSSTPSGLLAAVRLPPRGLRAGASVGLSVAASASGAAALALWARGVRAV